MPRSRGSRLLPGRRRSWNWSAPAYTAAFLAGRRRLSRYRPLNGFVNLVSRDSNRQFPILVVGIQAASKATRAYFHLVHGNREIQQASIQAPPVRRSGAQSRAEQHWVPEDAQGRPAG